MFSGEQGLVNFFLHLFCT